MSDTNQPDTQTPETPADQPATKVEVRRDSAPAVAPAAEQTPAEQPSAEPAANPEPTNPAQQPVVSDWHSGSGKKGRKWLKLLLALIVIAALAAGGWYLYQNHQNNAKRPLSAQSTDISKLRVGVVQADFGNLYPDMSASEYTFLFNAQMFEGLVRYENTNKIVPDLASTWTNPDDKTWLFTITPGVKFHDGHTLSAKDVKYSLDTVIANNSEIAQIFGDSIDTVTVVGENQVKITTKKPDPILLNKLVFLYIIDSNLPKGQEPSQAGTGPYMVKPGTKLAPNKVQMVAFNGYHGGVPKTKELEFGSTPSVADMVKDFKKGLYDIAGPVPSSDTNQNTHTFISSEPNVEYIGFNASKAGPQQNKLFREAVRYALNGKKIGEVATGNRVSAISQLIPPSIPGYNPSITPYKQDTAKAKQLLAQAGYPNGTTLRISNSDDSHATDEIVKELKAAGITVDVDHHSDFDEFIDYFNGGQTQAYSVNYTSDTLDGLDILSTALTSPNYSNPKLDDLLQQASNTNDPAKRLKLLQQAETVVDQDIPVVPLYSENDVWLMNKDYAIQQDMPSSLISVYFYKAHLK